MLRDPSIIAAEVARQQAEGVDSLLLADRDAASRRLAKIERQQEKLIRQWREAEGDTFPWELVQREITAAEKEKDQLRDVLADLDRRIAQQEAATHQLEALSAYQTRVGANLDAMPFERKRMWLEALDVRVIANGRDWRINGSLPLDNDAGILCTTC